MSGYSFVLLVVGRDKEEDYRKFLKDNGIVTVLSELCEGAAQRKGLDAFGLESREKVILSCVTSNDGRGELRRRLNSEMRIDAPNNGIAVFVNLESVGGASALKSLCSEKAEREEVEEKMKDMQYSLVVIIAQYGHADEIMDAAREGGATGGTIVKARGTSGSGTSKFFGVSIGDEKEIIYIVTSAEKREGVMSSIMRKAGSSSPAKSVVFSMPVEAVEGIHIPQKEDK